MKLLTTLGVASATALLATAATSNDKAQDAAAATKGATVTGRIIFDGEAPEAKPLTIKEDQAKGCCAPGEKVSDTNMSLMVDKDGGIANVVVQITVDGAKVEIPEEPLVIDQKNCRFAPHVIITPTGSKVRFDNSDGISHNIHTYAVKNEGLNKTVAAGQSIEQKLEKSEAVKVACDIHPWMEGYVYVTDATHWALSGRDGSFQIEGLPAGKHSIEVWHEKLGKGKGEVTVNADGTSEAVEIKMSEKKTSGRRRR